MPPEDMLKGKRILAVDDEHDVLQVIEEQLEECSLQTADTYESARDLLESQSFDLAVLDIMGVRGFTLLEMARERRIPAVMLTAHAMTPESLQKSIDSGAVSFLPKDELARLSELIREILAQVEEGKTHWPMVSERLGPRFAELWGSMWDQIRFPKDHDITW